MKIATALPVSVALLILAVQVDAHPGTRHSRQDLRMLPANATGTPQDHALASGVVLQEAAHDALQPPAQDPTSSTPSMTSASSGATTGPSRTTEVWRKLTTAGTPVGSPMGSAMGAPGGSPVPPIMGHDRTKLHPGLAPEQLGGEDSNIVFPSPPIKTEGPSGQPKFDPFSRAPTGRAPACAKGSTFCTDIDNYPENYLQTMLRSATVGLGYREYFGNDVIAESNITQRIDANDENPLCPYEETVVYPKVAKNKEDKWLYVVNQDHFVQGVRIETCLNSGTACQLAENFPYGYTTSCRQKYILRKLVALNPEGQTQTDMFRLPSCCSCYVTRSNVSSRRSNMTPVKKAGSQKR